jgi:hypothetical protein
MKTIIALTAYTWAIISMLLIPVTFMGNNFFAVQLARMSFMKINPVYSGGEAGITYQKDSLRITVNKPVFAALFGSSSKGFVQVKFSGDKNIPTQIAQDIDYDGDKNPDFNININTVSGETKFISYSKNVSELSVSSKVKDYWVIRVRILNPSKTKN